MCSLDLYYIFITLKDIIVNITFPNKTLLTLLLLASILSLTCPYLC